MRQQPAIALLAAALLLAACQQTPSGGALNSATGAPAGRAANLQSVFLGSQLGAALNSDDKASEAKAEQRAYTAPIGQHISWSNPDSGNAGAIVPVREGYAPNGAYCREFQQTITLAGLQPQQLYSKACQQPDGSWKIVQ